MIKLSGRAISINKPTDLARTVIQVSDNPHLPDRLKSKRAYLARSREVPSGFALYISLPKAGDEPSFPKDVTSVKLSSDFEYLANDDIISLNSDGSFKVLFRASSPHNFFLVTEKCNSYCLMCSQPPKAIDDSWIIDELRQVIPLISETTSEIGFTGGEPFIFGDRFLDLLRLTKAMLPRTAVHILSNGRLFADKAFAKSYASIGHSDMMVGIPLYSDDATIHDYVVQARGAFDETVRGILNLKELKQRVEIRVVLHRQTVGRLPQLAEFISRNLLFVDQVALMGLEITGFTRANLEQLWIDPKDYAEQLTNAASIFEAYRVPFMIYNHQLCTVDRSLWQYCQKSISDWKNEYLPICDSCSVKNECGGFFSSSKLYRHSDYINPL